MSALVADRLPIEDRSVANDSATNLFTLLVSTLQLARAVDDPMLSDQVLDAGITGALTLAQISRPTATERATR